MESSALNKAHLQHRKADTHMRHKRFDEAILCHKNAAENLEEAMKLTKASRALESLRLQQDFHIRQQEIVKLKKSQYEMYKKSLENQQNRLTRILKIDHIFDSSKEPESYNSLQYLIYRNIEVADSLLEMLVHHDEENDTDSAKTEEEDKSKSDVCRGVVGSKQPKDEQVVIEELRTLNQQLRSFVMQLIEQLEVKENENARLRERVKMLEAEKEAKHHVDPPHKTSLHVITDSSGGNSPFVFSPCGDLSPDVLDANVCRDRDLPPLAPLEMPNFDFSVFMKHTTNNPQETEEQ